MVRTHSKKNGFTLIEILIAMVILSVFFMAAAKILTIKPKRQYKISVHGLYECYYDGDTLKYHEVYESNNQSPKDAGEEYCTFTPSRNVAYYNIIVVYMDGRAYSDLQPSISGTMQIYPNSLMLKSDTDERIYTSASEMTLSKDELSAYLNSTAPNSKIIDVIKQTSHKPAFLIHW